jgi:hypothetical protein
MSDDDDTFSGQVFTYAVKAHDPMFPGKPDVYLYGCGPSVTQPGKNAVLFGKEKKQSMLIEGNSQHWAKVVAESVALLYSCETPESFASHRLFGKLLLTRAVLLTKK